MYNNTLKNFNLINPSKESVATVTTNLDTVAIQYWQHMKDTAWTHRYHMSPAENQMLQSCFERILVYPRGPYKHSLHPVLAALNDFANEDAAAQIDSLKKTKTITLSIGDSVNKKLRAHHNCLLLGTSREDFRVATSRDNQLTPHVVCNDRTYHCVNGAQNCDYGAEHAFAVHSLYDVSMCDLGEIFARHRLLTMTVYMYFTTTLYEGGLTDPYPFFKVTHVGNESKFYMNDESIIYTHNTKRWRAWHSTTGIYCQGFNLVFEVVRSYGPLRIIKIARVRSGVLRNISRCIPLSRIFGNCCLVPDMYSAVKFNYCVRQNDVRHFVVPQDIVNAIMAYVQRAADEGYKWPEIATYYSGLIRRIRIGSETIQEPFICSESDSYRILISIFILGALQRQDRTKSISSAFKYIKDHADMGCVKGFIYRKIQRLMVHYSKSASSWQHDKDFKIVAADNDASEFGFWFHEFHIRPIVDVEVNQIHDYRRWNNDDGWVRPQMVFNLGDPHIEGRLLPIDYKSDGESDDDDNAVVAPCSSSVDDQSTPPTVIDESSSLSSQQCVPSSPSTGRSTGRLKRLLSKAKTLFRNNKIIVGHGNLQNVSINNDDNGTVIPAVVIDEDLIDFDSSSVSIADNSSIADESSVSGVSSVDDADAIADESVPPADKSLVPCSVDVVEGVTSSDASVTKITHQPCKLKVSKRVTFDDSINNVQDADLGISIGEYLNEHLPIYDYIRYCRNVDKPNLFFGCRITVDRIDFSYSNNVNPVNGQDLVKYCEQFSDYNFPDKFLAGHCAIQSVYECLIKRGLIGQDLDARSFIVYSSALLVNYIGVLKELNLDVIERYIMHGVYEGSNISNILLEAVACNLGIDLFIQEVGNFSLGFNAIGTGNTCYIYAGDVRRAVRIYHSFNDDGGHFSSTAPGGVITKYAAILEDIDPKKHPAVLDLSCAPGWVTNHLRSRGFNVFAAHYKPGVPLKSNLKKKVDFSYDDIDQLFAHIKNSNMKFDVVINDIGTAINSEAIIDKANFQVPSVLNDNGILVTKTFGNPHALWKMCNWSNMHLAYMATNNTERIFKCYHKVGHDVDNFYKRYDTPGWNRPTTTHVLPHVDVDSYCDKFFVGKLGNLNLSDYRPRLFSGNKDNFVISAITGYASSSKTSDAIKTYKNAVFIAPSRQLSDRLISKGVKCYTPHLFFGNSSKNKFNSHSNFDTIIVDECFQFDFRYFVLLHQVYPNHNIVVLGDVHQTPPCNLTNERIETLEDYGVRNNIVDVYSIPKDICGILNNKHGFKIRSHSNVSKGLFRWVNTSGIKSFVGSKLPVITFNQATAERLSNLNIQASTITTYTGSRAPVVVLYVDSSSIMSSILEKPKYLYTAMSRASSQLLIVDDGSVLSQYYNIAITPVSRLEDINGINVSHSITLPSTDGFVPLVGGKLHTDTCSLHCAQTIVADYMQPINDPAGEFINVSTRDVHKVQSGTLTVNKDMLLDHNTKHTVYRVVKNKFSKHQMSNNTLEAINTLNKRYSKRYESNDKRLVNYTLNELLNGLCLAIYGNASKIRKLKQDLRMSHEYVQERQVQYFEKLNLKLKDPSVLKEIDNIRSLPEERLNFFNKRQSKFDPAVGFDSSPKVGQGVAATSKRINVLFCGWARALMDRVRELLVRNKRDILLATHDSEQVFNAKFLEMKSKHGVVDNYTCNDFSEWDASFRNPFVKLTAYLLKASGCPKDIVNDFTNFRESWVMQYQTCWGIATLSGNEKQFSGNPFTIFENTIGNMALCFSIFDYTGFKFALFKGDDSAVACDKCVMLDKARDILTYTGHGLKLHNSQIGEFAGWFLTDRGLFPDVLRHTSKFLDKLYYDEDHFSEVVQSLQCRCDAVVDTSQLICGAVVCAAYYNNYAKVEGSERVLSARDMENLFYFMRGSRSIKFSDLEKVDMRSLKIDNKGEFISK